MLNNGIVGIEKLEFGVEDLAQCRRFLKDFGLTAEANNINHFHTLNGAQVQLYASDDRQLPAAFESGSTLRRITWGVADNDALDRLATTLASHAGFQVNQHGIEVDDPNGMRLCFALSQTKAVDVPVIPLNQWGAIQRIDQASPVYEQAEPINIGHVVFFVDDLAKTEAFYCQTLGFQVSDRYINKAVFLRAQIQGCHHHLFLLKLPQRGAGLNHVAFNVRDIHEVIGGGLAMNRHHWSTFIGPGRHPISSAYFWYVNSPTGGAFEYYTNDDYITEKWIAREIEHSLTSFTEWAIEGGLDYQTRRQLAKQETD